MVPVPAEHVLDVMRWVLFRATEDEEARLQDEQRVTELVAEADEPTRRLLVAVAAATLKNESLRLQDLAFELELEVGETNLAIEALNERALDGRELIEVRKDPTVGVRGKLGAKPFVTMRPDLAPIVRTATRAAPKPA